MAIESFMMIKFANNTAKIEGYSCGYNFSVDLIMGDSREGPEGAYSVYSNGKVEFTSTFNIFSTDGTLRPEYGGMMYAIRCLHEIDKTTYEVAYFVTEVSEDSENLLTSRTISKLTILIDPEMNPLGSVIDYSSKVTEKISGEHLKKDVLRLKNNDVRGTEDYLKFSLEDTKDLVNKINYYSRRI